MIGSLYNKFITRKIKTDQNKYINETTSYYIVAKLDKTGQKQDRIHKNKNQPKQDGQNMTED